MNNSRIIEKIRKTNETEIALRLNLDGKGETDFDTGIPFWEHLLHNFCKHSLCDLRLGLRGDLEIDCHHSVEDSAIVLGQALEEGLGDKKGIYRYGHFTLPMDETLVSVALDFGGRPFYKYNGQGLQGKIGNYDLELTDEFLQKLAMNAKMNLHVTVHYGQNLHHIHEGIFKALGRAMRMAWQIDVSNATAIPSTKGVL